MNATVGRWTGAARTRSSSLWPVSTRLGCDGELSRGAFEASGPSVALSVISDGSVDGLPSQCSTPGEYACLFAPAGDAVLLEDDCVMETSDRGGAMDSELPSVLSSPSGASESLGVRTFRDDLWVGARSARRELERRGRSGGGAGSSRRKHVRRVATGMVTPRSEK